MYGFDAISAQNGWHIALTGIAIVFCGLLILALAISQLHTILELWKKKGSYYKLTKNFLHNNGWHKTDVDNKHDKIIEANMCQYFLLTQRMDEAFSLPKLLEFGIKRGLSRPHNTINELLHANLLTPDGEGYFQWSNKAYNIFKNHGSI